MIINKLKHMIMENMKVNLQTITEKEKEHFIMKMAIDMKEIGKTIKEKVKEHIIIKMVIEKWEII